MINYDKPVQMKDGTPVTILASNLMGEFPILGTVEVNGNLCYCLWTRQGKTLPNTFNPEENELENILPQEKKVWLNVYSTDGDVILAHPTRKSADKSAGQSRIARIKMTFKEGRFDK